MRALSAFVALAFLAGCGLDLARPTERDVQARVTDAADRLGATEAGQRVLSAIDAHGGLAAWYGGGPLRFRYAYTRLDSLGDPAGPPIDTRQLVDPWASRAVHTLASDSTVSFGWTGTEAARHPEVPASVFDVPEGAAVLGAM